MGNPMCLPFPIHFPLHPPAPLWRGNIQEPYRGQEEGAEGAEGSINAGN